MFDSAPGPAALGGGDVNTVGMYGGGVDAPVS